MSPQQTRNRETARAAPPPAGLLRLPQLLQQRDRLTLDPAREPRADGIETTPIRESRKLPLIMIRQAQNNRKQKPTGVPQTAVQLRCRRWDLRRWRARKSAMRSSFCMSTWNYLRGLALLHQMVRAKILTCRNYFRSRAIFLNFSERWFRISEIFFLL